jgi:hypothetical protein
MIKDGQNQRIARIGAPRTQGFVHLGSGFLVSEKIMITAGHVLDAVRNKLVSANSVHVETSSGWLPVELLGENKSLDLAVLRLPQPLGKPFPLVIGQTGRLSECNHDFTAEGFPVGNSEGAASLYRLRPSDFEFSGKIDRAGVYSDFQARGGIEEGCSGGPLYVSDLPDKPVLGMILSGGKDAGQSRFLGSTQIIRYLWTLGVEVGMLDWAVLLQEQHEADFESACRRWVKLLELPGNRAIIRLWGKHTQMRFAFRLVLPSEMKCVPFLLAERVVPEAVRTTGLNDRALLGLSWREARQVIQEAAPSLSLDLPTHFQWEAAFSGGGRSAIAPDSGQVRRGAAVSIRGKRTAWGLEYPPSGCEEFVRRTDEEPAGWIAPSKTSGMATRSGGLDPNRRVAYVSFRACLPVTSALFGSNEVTWESQS